MSKEVEKNYVNPAKNTTYFLKGNVPVEKVVDNVEKSIQPTQIPKFCTGRPLDFAQFF